MVVTVVVILVDEVVVELPLAAFAAAAFLLRHSVVRELEWPVVSFGVTITELGLGTIGKFVRRLIFASPVVSFGSINRTGVVSGAVGVVGARMFAAGRAVLAIGMGSCLPTL